MQQVENGDVPLTALDGADKSTVEPAPVTKLLLRHLQRDSSFADSIAKLSQKGTLFQIHA